MKKIILPLFTLVLFCFSGCNSDDDNNDSGLLDTWTLINAGGGFSGASYDYEKSLITAKFKADGKVEIMNRNTDESKPGFFETGVYDYAEVDNTSQIMDCSKSMTIENATFYCYQIDGQDRLILDDSPVDGIKYTFIRN